jgi:WD40 repeat protein
MDERQGEEQDARRSHADHAHLPMTDADLGERIARALREQAEHLHFTSVMQQRLHRHLLLPPAPARRRRRYLAFSVAAVCLLILSITLYTVFTGGAQLSYRLYRSLPTPAYLAQEGRLLSLDPTGRHLVYEPAKQPGTLYTFDLDDPLATNLLAMRYASDVAWSPDGSALVTTIRPPGTYEPLLALVPSGKYMHLLGHEALATSWSPAPGHAITFVTQAAGHTQLWATDASGAAARLLASMPLSQDVQRLAWSPNGQMLALITTQSTSLTASSFAQPARAIYIMDTHSGRLQKLVSAENASIGTVAWSPDGDYVTYEQVNFHGQVSLQAVAPAGMDAQHLSFSIAVQRQLLGWSWSDDSRTLVYSDGGSLHAHILNGPALRFPASKALQEYPFWLPDGHLLYVGVTAGAGRLMELQRAT